MRALSSTLYKYTIFFSEIQIALTFRYNSEMLKCSDLHKLGSAMYYITRRAPKVCIRMHVKGGMRRRRWLNTRRFRYRARLFLEFMYRINVILYLLYFSICSIIIRVVAIRFSSVGLSRRPCRTFRGD